VTRVGVQPSRRLSDISSVANNTILDSPVREADTRRKSGSSGIPSPKMA
jgi:hypothetical protein